MKRMFYLLLSCCLILLCLPACKQQVPTADVHAVQLGDTEAQVIEKAGAPDAKKGLGYDVFGYSTNEYETEWKLLWIRNEKVVMIATYKAGQFSNWLVDDAYAFQSLKHPEEISVWEPGLDIYDIIGYLGPKFTLQGIEYVSTMTYAFENNERLEIHLWMDLIQEVIHIKEDGTETVLWELNVN